MIAVLQLVLTEHLGLKNEDAFLLCSSIVAHNGCVQWLMVCCSSSSLSGRSEYYCWTTERREAYGITGSIRKNNKTLSAGKDYLANSG